MENNSGFWKWVGAVVLVVVLGLALGFYLSGPPSDEANAPASSQSTSTDEGTGAAATSAASAPPVQAARIGEYTAKGAPSIVIDEQNPLPKKPSASKTSGAATSATVPSSAANSTSAPASPSTTPSAPPSGADSGASPAPVAPPAPAHQESAAQTQTTPTQSAQQQGDSTPSDNAPLYHVLVGTTFTSEKNARIFAADLRHRGFMAMTSTVTSDSGTVYKVQVGAYRNRLAAEQTATQLQQSGFPAYIATDR
ncbi:MAG: SPOR domain-containing protein [Capsulimonadaceae bacterium]|nr:SPOR domain-containing protein [Capsulimonadaceae bacterium]